MLLEYDDRNIRSGTNLDVIHLTFELFALESELLTYLISFQEQITNTYG
jgi:hypothetical protein